MKIGTHLTILGNLIPLISGVSLYFLLTGQYEHALIVGIGGAIYGNLHTRYIVKRAKKEMPQMIMSMLIPESIDIDKERIEDIVRRVKK